jgi:hypothetical protein
VIAALGSTLVSTALLLAPAGAPPVQRPAPIRATPAPAPTEPAPTEPAPTDTTTEPAEGGGEPTPTDTTTEPAEGGGEPSDTTTEPAEGEGEPTPTDVTTDPAEGEGELRVAAERPGPPFYTEADLAELRQVHQVEPTSPPPREPVRWRCLIADPTCRHSFEVQAMGAYALRARQGDVNTGTVDRWHSARAQYDLWLSLPALVETEGKNRYTRMSLGPKGGVVFSDTGDLWGNVGIAGRYWLGRGRWAPSIEFTSALTFKLATREAASDAAAERFRMQRGPVGFQADVGFGLGGFGALVVGGQYDSPLAREDVPDVYRVYSSGMFFVGFRGNILWGGPAAAAVAAHASTRAVQRP